MSQKPEPPRAENRRKSDRISLSIPIVVFGTDIASGQDFVEKARTVQVSRTGGAIVVSRVLGPERTVFIKCAATRKEAEARVVGQLGIQLDSHIYGVAMLDPSVDLWGIRFPDLSEAERALGRVCLQCAACGTREVCYLTEVEVAVFDVNRNLSRSCNQCGKWTLWNGVAKDLVEPAAASEIKTEAASPAPAPVAAAPSEPKNRRRFARTNMRKSGCVRQPGSEPDIVQVLDMSRGGVRFRSKQIYHRSSWVEIAVPYIGGGVAEIFVPGRIASIIKRKDGQHEYGIAYVR